MLIIVLSGPIAAGKSTLATYLVTRLAKEGFKLLHTRKYIESRLRQASLDIVMATRSQLQEYGHYLDREQPLWLQRWLLEECHISVPVITGFVVDCARRVEHVDSLRRIQGAEVIHVHLEANPDSLQERYSKRNEDIAYERAKSDTLEVGTNQLRNIADLVINTSNCTASDTYTRVHARMNADSYSPNVDVIVGGQYGSEGKGHIVAHLAPEYSHLVRVGGPNAGHSVLFNNGVEQVHTAFYHLPSGVLHAPQADLLLGAGINIRIPTLLKEIKKCEDLGVRINGRLFIDTQANVITDDDIELESGIVRSVGSTGQGVGYATARKIMFRGDRKLARDYPELRPYLANVQEQLFGAYRSCSRIMLEGTQGTGLSLYHGQYPYVTSRDTTATGTMAEAGIPHNRIRKVLMVVRTNPIRVQSPEGGTSGPMSKEVEWDQVALRAGVPVEELRKRETTTTTKRQRRVSEFDWTLLHYSTWLNGPTDIALTFTDYLSPMNQEARRFEQLTPETRELIQEIETVSKVPVSLITTRLHQRSIIDRRKGWR